MIRTNSLSYVMYNPVAYQNNFCLFASNLILLTARNRARVWQRFIFQHEGVKSKKKKKIED